MPITPDEIPALLPLADELRAALDAALRKDDDGKVRVEPKEWARIGKAALRLALAIGRDALD